MRVCKGGLVHPIPAEKLVGALTRKHGFHAARGKLVNEIQGHRTRIGGRLIHMPLHKRHRLPKLILGYVMGVVFHAKQLGELARPAHLVTLSPILRKTHGERFDLGILFRKACRQIARIDTARQKRPHLDIGNIVVANRLAHRGINGVDRFLTRATRIKAIRRLPIASHRKRSVCIHAQAMTLRKLVHILEKGLMQRRELKAQVLRERILVKLPLVGRMFENAFDFRCEYKTRSLNGVVERLDPEKVTRAEQLL